MEWLKENFTVVNGSICGVVFLLGIVIKQWLSKTLIRQETWILWMLQNGPKDTDAIYEKWSDPIYYSKGKRGDTYGRTPKRPGRTTLERMMTKLKNSGRIIQTAGFTWKIKID